MKKKKNVTNAVSQEAEAFLQELRDHLRAAPLPTGTEIRMTAVAAETFRAFTDLRQKRWIVAGCAVAANWQEGDELSDLIELYTHNVPGPATEGSDEEMAAGAREWARCARKVMADFMRDPADFKRRCQAAFDISPFDDIEIRTDIIVGPTGIVEYVHGFLFPSAESSIRLCTALLADPTVEAEKEIRACLRCGKYFPRHKTKRLYCSEECSTAADNRQAAQRVARWRQRQKRKARKPK